NGADAAVTRFLTELFTAASPATIVEIAALDADVRGRRARGARFTPLHATATADAVDATGTLVVSQTCGSEIRTSVFTLHATATTLELSSAPYATQLLTTHCI